MSALNILVPFVTAVLGLLVGHVLATERDKVARRQQLRVTYLIDAYRKLERGAQPTSVLYASGDFEAAIADIQLFGRPSQVSLAHKFCEAASAGNGTFLQELLEDVRLELRGELNLPKKVVCVRPFRISAANNSSKRTR